MSSHPELDLAAGLLRSAVERNDFAAAAAIGSRYAEAVRRLADEMPPEDARRLLTEADLQMEESRRKLCTARARIRDRLRRLRRAAAYGQTKEPGVHTCNVSG